MAGDLVDEPAPFEEKLSEEPHLHDLGSIHEVANWILLAAASGVIGNAVYDVLRACSERFGDGSGWTGSPRSASESTRS